MTKIRCTHCDAVLEITGTSPYVVCPKCGTRYKNPDAREVSHEIRHIKCRHCETVIEARPYLQKLICPNCGTMYVNPYYDKRANKSDFPKPAKPAKPAPSPSQTEASDQNANFGAEDTYFDSSVWKLLLRKLLHGFLLVITLGLAYVWVFCRAKRWEINGKVINGKRLVFTGRGGELFWKWLGSMCLIVLTLGLYSFKYRYKLDKYVAEHTQVVGEENTPSVFSADIEGKIGLFVINLVLTVFTFGFYHCWALCREYRWNFNHQTISGHKLVFNGRGIELLGKQIVWGLLSVVTLGVFLLFKEKKVQQWIVKHCAFVKP